MENKRKSRTKITPELVEEMRRLVMSGMKNTDICRKLNIGSTTLTNCKKKYNIEYKKPTAEDIKDYIISLHEEGKSVREICSLTGYSSSTTIKSILNKYNIKGDKERKIEQLKESLKLIIPKCFSVYEVSKKAGCSPTTVRKYMKELNISLNLKYVLTDEDVKNISLEPLKYPFDSEITTIPKEDKKEFLENKIRHIIIRTRQYVPLILLKEFGINSSLIAYHHINVPEINKEFGLTIKYASALEVYFAQFCENNNILYESQKTFDGCTYKGNLRFDYYLPEYDTLIEIQGKQHYEENSMFGGNEQFTEQQIRDNIKEKWCKENNKTLYKLCYKDLYKKDYLESVISQIVAKSKLGELLETPEVDNQQLS